MEDRVGALEVSNTTIYMAELAWFTKVGGSWCHRLYTQATETEADI